MGFFVVVVKEGRPLQDIKSKEQSKAFMRVGLSVLNSLTSCISHEFTSIFDVKVHK